MPQPGQKILASGKFMDGNGSRKVLVASDLEISHHTSRSQTTTKVMSAPGMGPDFIGPDDMQVEVDMPGLPPPGMPPPMMMGPGFPGIGMGPMGPGPAMMAPHGRRF
jgi:hypothetical protein